jgi:hypothetical protein
MDYEKLFRFAQVAVTSCTTIEETQRFVSSPEYQEAFNALSPEEKEQATLFIGSVNGLRWQIKQNATNRLRDVLAMSDAERAELQDALNLTWEDIDREDEEYRKANGLPPRD